MSRRHLLSLFCLCAEHVVSFCVIGDGFLLWFTSACMSMSSGSSCGFLCKYVCCGLCQSLLWIMFNFLSSATCLWVVGFTNKGSMCLGSKSSLICSTVFCSSALFCFLVNGDLWDGGGLCICVLASKATCFCARCASFADVLCGIADVEITCRWASVSVKPFLNHLLSLTLRITWVDVW